MTASKDKDVSPKHKGWGSFRIPHKQTGYWKLGPLALYVQRLPGEWRLAFENGTNAFDAECSQEIPCRIKAPLDSENTVRFAVADSDEIVHLSLALPDRPLVTRSESPLHVLPMEKATIFASIPLWLRIEVGDEKKQLSDIPIFRPTDTWFGANTQEGELCYASRTFHRVRLSQMPVLSHRATTQVTVQNNTKEMLSLERMLVSVTHLSLYLSTDGTLWTDDLFLESLEPDGFAMLRTRARTDQVNSSTTDRKMVKICEPREVYKDNLIVQAFSSLFSSQDVFG